MPITSRQGFPAPLLVFLFIFCLYIKVYSQSCRIDSVVWVCTSDGKLCWGNLSTGAEFMVGDDPGHFMLDIAWASDGKLYGPGGSPSGVYEVDPVTALATFKGTLPQPYTGIGNSMAADQEGNLFLVGYIPEAFLLSKPQIIRLNIATWQTCVIVPDLRTFNLSSAGDLTFINGFLYLSSGGNRIAKINIHTGDVKSKDVMNSTTGGYFGLTTLGDGFLYACDRGKIYRIDPNTMIAETTPAFTFSFQNLFMNGLATYAELCHAPPRFSVDLGRDTTLCITEDLYLSPANTSGIMAFRWQDGSTGTRVFAEKTGWYWLEATGVCGVARDSVHVTFRDDGCARLIYMPSAFTPNHDGRNDLLKPVVRNKLAEYEFSIYNRWGQKVFTTRDHQLGWDGTLNGHQQDAGLFTWFCRYRFNRKPAQTIKGTVVLVR